MSGTLVDGVFAGDEENVTRLSLTDEPKLTCIPIERGYSLEDKFWLQFFVNPSQLNSTRKKESKFWESRGLIRFIESD